MNVRKRGLALLMCICMIFTLLPFSVFAEDAENGNRGGTEGTAQQSVVYGKYDNGTWTQKTGLTAVGEPYTNSATGADVTYSKTATPVEGQKDTYNITLKIESKTSSTAPGASAVVLVIDSSGSMKDGRLTNAKNVAKSFIDSYGTSGSDRYLAVVNFDTYANAFEFGRDKTSWLDVSNGTNRQTAKNRFDNLSVGGGTNLEQGLTKAKDLLNNNTVKSIAKENKFVIVLTDGEPTFYNNTKNWNILTFSYQPEGTGKSCDQDTYDATVTAATELKSSANSVYTVCYGAQNEIIDCTKETVSNFLKTKIATSAGLAYEASDGSESLKEAFGKIYESIQQGLSSGFTVTDPMGAFIQLDKSSIKDATAKVNGNTITWTPTTGEVSEENGVKTYTYTLTYTVKLDTAANGFVDNKYYATNGVTTLAFKDGDENITRNFNVPGVKGETYTVTYNKGDHGTLNDQNGEGNVVHSKLQLNSKTPTAPEVTADDGYYFTGWEPTVAETVTGNATYTAQYKIKDDLSYTVHYYWNGTNDKVAEDKVVESQTFNTIVTEKPAAVTGYTPVSDAAVELTIGTDTNANVITFYYYKNVELKANGDTVTYDGKVHSVSGFTGAPEGADFSAIKVGATGTEAGTYPANFADNTVGTVDATGKYIVTKTTNGNLTIDPIGTVTVTITGKHDSKVYNGTEQSVEGYTVDVPDNSITVVHKEGKTAIAKGTNVGHYEMNLEAADFEASSDNYSNIKVVVVDGYLDITPVTDEVVVTIKGNTDSKVYNGTEQSVEGYTVDVPDNSITVVHKEGKTAIAKGTNVGHYEMNLEAADFEASSDNYSNIKVVVVDGYLDITPITDEVVVTITGHKDEFTYDGKEHTVTGYDTSISNQLYKATDFTFTGKAEVSRTEVGTSDMGLKNDHFQNVSKNFENVKFVINDGSITIKERPYIPPVNPPITDKITVEITGNSDSVVYDGTEHSVKDYTVKISDSRYTEKDFTFSGKALASGVNAGTYEMGLKADQFKNTNARFTNVEFIIKADGVLTITQRPLTITAGSAEGIAPVTCDKYTVEGLATGDKVDSVKITGIQSEPGESPNVASDAVIKNAKGEDVTANYKITYVNGVLKAIEVLNKEIHFNYVIGYTDGTIRPNNDISRAEVATIFFRLLTDEAREQYTTTAGNFTDVKAGMWCNRAIATLTNMGIIKGYTDGSFQPNKSITRAELATIIARFAKLDVNTKTFSDINGHWAQKNIELAAGNGWINGYEDGTFRPNNNITRAETFAMINRVLDRQTESVSDLLPTSEMNMWSDNLNENAWYYKDVQEATNYHKCDRVGDSVYEKWTEKVPDIDWASYQI